MGEGRRGYECSLRATRASASAEPSIRKIKRKLALVMYNDMSCGCPALVLP